MRRTKIAAVAASLLLALTLGACGSTQSTEDVAEESAASAESDVETEEAQADDAEAGGAEADEADVVEVTEPAADSAEDASDAAGNPMGTVSNTLAEDEDGLVSTYASAFTQETYTDSDTGLSVTYNLFLPAGYDESTSYPMVMFVADSSCAGGDATRSLNQGLGAVVWASEEWQAANPCIVCVPTYPETILDDHGSYTTTEYVELTKRLIDTMVDQYAVDASRIYGTGQSMGCMTTLILASEYPDLYAACMFVDGQWDVTTLSGLEGQTFVYFAAEDDENAFAGMSEVKAMFDADSASYAAAQWDGTWSPDDLSAAAQELFAAGESANFVSWTTGTIYASSGGMMGGAAYHMASFDYAYRCIAVMEWLFQQ